MKSVILLFLLPLSVFAKTFIPSSFTANFEESFVSVTTGKEKKSFGKIDYKYPGHVRFEKTSPDPSMFVSNPKESWYYVPPFVAGEQGQVTVQKSSKLPLGKFLDSVKNGFEGQSTTVKGREMSVVFKKELQKKLTLKQVTLHAIKEAKDASSLSDFEKITLVYEDGRKVDLKFIDLKENVSLSDDQFVFKVPANTKVINQ